jgi:hypothetical protein
MALGIVAIVLAVAALILPFAIERKRRPKLRIELGEWKPEQRVDWEFAPVRIINEPLSGIWGLLLTRQSAEGCIVNFTIRAAGQEKALLSGLPGRWSGTPEPYRSDTQLDQAGRLVTIETFDHTLVPDSFRFNVPSTGGAEEVALVVFRDGAAYAFNSWSYAHPKWRKPDWKLEPGTYEVVVRASATGDETSAIFTLTVSAEDGLDLKCGPPV